MSAPAYKSTTESVSSSGSDQLKLASLPCPAEDFNFIEKKRVPWRQRLVETEQGIRRCLRNDSTIFVHLFFATLTFCAAFVLSVPTSSLIILFLCLMCILGAELFHFALMETLDLIERNDSSDVDNEAGQVQAVRFQNARSASTAAVMLMILVSCLITGFIFYQQVRGLF